MFGFALEFAQIGYTADSAVAAVEIDAVAAADFARASAFENFPDSAASAATA